jgi:hypothetical protein
MLTKWKKNKAHSEDVSVGDIGPDETPFVNGENGG